MKFSMMFRLFGSALNGITGKAISDREICRKIRRTYRAVAERAEDIGSGNNLLSSYALAAYFIAMNREDGLSAEENYRILDQGMRKSRLLKAFMGNAKGYFSSKHMEFRRKWAGLTQDPAHQKAYGNDWVVEVVEGGDGFVFGLDYTRCGVCSLCRDEGCPELARYLCRLDFMLVELIGVHLERTQTLAEGAPKCDFRFSALK